MGENKKNYRDHSTKIMQDEYSKNLTKTLAHQVATTQKVEDILLDKKHMPLIPDKEQKIINNQRYLKIDKENYEHIYEQLVNKGAQLLHAIEIIKEAVMTNQIQQDLKTALHVTEYYYPYLKNILTEWQKIITTTKYYPMPKVYKQPADRAIENKNITHYYETIDNNQLKVNAILHQLDKQNK